MLFSFLEKEFKQRQIHLIVFVLSMVLVPWLGFYEFYSRGEPREALVAQSMLLSGDWVLPKAYNDEVPSKPPLFHWLVAVASIPFGEVTEFAARLPSALFALGALGFFLLMLRERFTSTDLLLFSIILSFSFEWLRASVSARVDMVHASSTAAGLLAYFLVLSEGKIRLWFLSVLSFTIATLSKGPVGVVIPGIILTIWVCLTPGRKAKRLTFLYVCLLSVLSISLLWYGAAYLRNPRDFFANFWEENVARFLGSMTQSAHNHPAGFLLLMFIVGTLPWSPLAICVALINFRSSKKSLCEYWIEGPALLKFSFVSTLSIVMFYCIPSSKRGVYLLAAYPFFALCATAVLRSRFNNRRAFIILAVGSIIVVTCQALVMPLVVVPQRGESKLGEFLKEELDSSQTAYSFGFEFYGAAFYSRRVFLRLENAYEVGGRVPRTGDLIVSSEGDSAALMALLEAKTLAVEKLRSVQIGKKSVNVFRII